MDELPGASGGFRSVMVASTAIALVILLPITLVLGAVAAETPLGYPLIAVLLTIAPLGVALLLLILGLALPADVAGSFTNRCTSLWRDLPLFARRVIVFAFFVLITPGLWLASGYHNYLADLTAGLAPVKGMILFSAAAVGTLCALALGISIIEIIYKRGQK